MATNPDKSTEEILAEMDKIDELELQGGIAAASPEGRAKAKQNPLPAPNKDKTEEQKRAERFMADGPEDW